MTPMNHAAVSGVTSVLFGSLTQSWSAGVVCFLSGIFIDVDHILDFMIYKKRISINYRELDSFCGKERGGKLYLIFHSYEALLLCGLIVIFFDTSVLWDGFVVGYGVHLVADKIVNPLKPLAYSFLYRMKNNFEKESLFQEGFYEKFF
ncbi:MAG: hypothetical protein WC552_05685 [Candidatus Omnitrophota bacterium]